MNKGHCTLNSMYEVNQEERVVTGLELPVLCLLSYMYHHQATTSPQNCVLHMCIAYFTTITNRLLSEPCPNYPIHPYITGVSPPMAPSTLQQLTLVTLLHTSYM